MQTTVDKPERTMERLVGLAEDAAFVVMVFSLIMIMAAIIALVIAL